MGKSKYDLPKNITYRPKNKFRKYMYVKCLNKDDGKYIQSSFKTLEEAIKFKEYYELHKKPPVSLPSAIKHRKMSQKIEDNTTDSQGYEFFCKWGYSESAENRYGKHTWWYYPENKNDILPENVLKNLTSDSLKIYKINIS